MCTHTHIQKASLLLFLPVPLKGEGATYSNVLVWGIPGMEEPGRLLSMGSHRVGHDEAT